MTVDGDTRSLPEPFFVLATQNPIELEGTFPLPEAQLDRSLLCVSLGYPTLEDEHAILKRFEYDRTPVLVPIVGPAGVVALQQARSG